MSLMANLYVGTSGVQVSQNALNTTAHNMSNIDTSGYTRQQVSQGTRSYSTLTKSNSAVAWQQIGLGVNYSNCKQVRSTFLDASYRLESGRSGFYDVSYSTLQEVEDQLQEMNGAEFADTLGNLWTSVQELAKDPTSTVNQSTFVTRCNEFVERAQAVYKGLTAYQSNLNDTVSTTVNQINSYGD
ncbi:MAG: flagellar hook-associated protein FlgK, partial [Butyrivibrio sp.]|nr:flagellar hook-associated protein FlgK [Butyrivibrio sp.]